jgi:hypothetical protein
MAKKNKIIFKLSCQINTLEPLNDLEWHVYKFFIKLNFKFKYLLLSQIMFLLWSIDLFKKSTLY